MTIPDPQPIVKANTIVTNQDHFGTYELKKSNPSNTAIIAETMAATSHCTVQVPAAKNWSLITPKKPSFNTLTTSFCKKNKATIIFRGLRAVSDFEYEFQLAGMNRKLDNTIETVFLMSDVDKQVISSKFVKEIALLKGNIKDFVTKSTIKSIKKKL